MSSRSALGFSFGCAALLCVAACSSNESDEHAEAAADSATVSEIVTTDARPNAAREYARIDALAGKDLLEPFDQLDSDDRLTPERAQYLTAKQDLIKEIMDAAAIERCEFVIDPDAGLNVVVPEYSAMRRFARILKYDAERRSKSVGGSRDAADRLIAVLRLSCHAGQSPLLLGKLVGLACMDLSTKAIEDNARQIAVADRQRLLSELERCRNSMLFDFSGALERERAESIKVIRRGEIPRGLAREASTIPEARRETVVKEVERAHEELKEVWGKPDAEQSIKRLVDSSTVAEAEAFISWMSMPPKLAARAQLGIDRAIVAMRSP